MQEPFICTNWLAFVWLLRVYDDGLVIMIDLSGELIAYPLPNQPGWWAYRLLPNGVLLTVELTKAEWFKLHEREHQKSLGKIREMDRHPLNIAARTLLERAREYPLPNEISLISLSRFALGEGVPDWNEALMALNNWGHSLATMQKAVWVLEEAQVTSEDLLSLDLVEAAQLVLEHLVG